MKLSTQDTSYKLWLLEEAWVPDEGGSAQESDAADVETEFAPEVVAPSAVALNSNSDLAWDVAGIESLFSSAISQLDARLDRRKWKQILTGEKQPEDTAQSTARDRLEMLQPPTA